MILTTQVKALIVISVELRWICSVGEELTVFNFMWSSLLLSTMLDWWYLSQTRLLLNREYFVRSVSCACPYSISS